MGVTCGVDSIFKNNANFKLVELKTRKKNIIKNVKEFIDTNKEFKSGTYVSDLNDFLTSKKITLSKSELENINKGLDALPKVRNRDFLNILFSEIEYLDEDTIKNELINYINSYNDSVDVDIDISVMLDYFIGAVNKFNQSVKTGEYDNKQKIHLSREFYAEVLKNNKLLVHDKVSFEAIDNPFNLIQDKVFSKFKALISENCFINRKTSTMIDTNTDLNAKLTKSKVTLLKTIVKELKPKITINGKEKINRALDSEILAAYKDIMGSVEVSNFVNEASSNDFKTQSDINVGAAIYILNNFDSMINNNFSKMIKVDKIFDGMNEMGYDKKYSFTDTSFITAFWNGEDFSSKDVSKNISNLAKYIVSTIPFTVEVEGGNPKVTGEYLNDRHLNYIAGVIRAVEFEMTSLDILGNSDLKSLSTNGTDVLKGILKFIVDGHSTIVGKSNLSIFKSFYDYLYESVIDEDGKALKSIRSIYTRNIDNKFVTADVMDIENLLLSNILKVSAPTYIEYDGETTNYKSLMLSFSGRTALQENALSWVKGTITSKLYNDVEDNNLEESKTTYDKLLDKSITKEEAFKEIFQLNDIQYAEVLRQFNTLEEANDVIDNFVTSITKLITASFSRSFTNNITDTSATSSYNVIVENLKSIDKDIQAEYFDTLLMELLDKLRFKKFDIDSDSSNHKLTYDYINNALLKNPITVFDNMLKNKIPVYSISTMAFNDSYNLINFINSIKETDVVRTNPSVYNIFTQFPNLLTNRNKLVRDDKFSSVNREYPANSTGFQLDLKSEKTITESKDFTKEQNLYVSFNHHFLGSDSKDIFTTELVNQSDKSRHVVKTINLQAEVLVNGKTKTLKSCDFQELVDLHYANQNAYGRYMYFQMLEFYKNLTGKDVKSGMNQFHAENVAKLFKDINTYYETSGITLDQLSQQFYDNGLNLIEEFHYSNYRVDGKMQMKINQSLYNKMLILSDSNLFKDDVNKNVSLFYNGTKDMEFMQENAEIYDPEQFKFHIQKYIMLTNIVKDNYLQLTVKFPYTDIIKSGKFETNFDEYKVSEHVPELQLQPIAQEVKIDQPTSDEVQKTMANNILNFINGFTDFDTTDFTAISVDEYFINKLNSNPELKKQLQEVIDKQLNFEYAVYRTDKFTFSKNVGKKQKAIEKFVELLNRGNEIKPYKVTYNSLHAKYATENSDRLKAFNKRMVSLPASVENYLLNSLFGLSEDAEIAIIKDLKLPVFSIDGKDETFDIMDGSAMANGFYSRLEEKSLPGKSLKGSKKPIGIYNDGVNSQLYKYAEFSINNEKCRASNKSEIVLKNLMKKMTDVAWTDKRIDLTKNYLDETFDNIEEMNSDKPIYFKKGLKYFRMLDFKFNEFGSYTISKQRVSSDGDAMSEVITEDVNINSIYSLWNMFGGEYSMDLINGELSFSESSIDIVTNFMNNVGFRTDGETDDLEKKVLNQSLIYQPLKHSMISFVANKSAVKRGVVNINDSISFTDNEPLRTTKIKLNNFGIQQDASHESDMSEVTSPSQLLAALATGGRSLNSVNNTYKELGNLVSNSIANLKEVITLSSEDTKNEISKKIKEKFINSETSGLSYAVSLMKDTFTEVFPLEDESFYKLLVTTCLGSINDAIKHKYAGGGEVLVPSAKMMQLYEINGKKYLQPDIVKLAVDVYADLELIEDQESEGLQELLTILDKEDEYSDIAQRLGLYVAKFLEDYDQDDLEEVIPDILDYIKEGSYISTVINSRTVKLYDSILIEDEIVRIGTLKQLRALHAKNEDFNRVEGVPRDLKPDETTYTVNGNTINLWTHPLITSINSDTEDESEETFKGTNFSLALNDFINNMMIDHPEAIDEFFKRNFINDSLDPETIIKSRATMLFLNMINNGRDFDYDLLTDESYENIFDWILQSDPKLDSEFIENKLSDVIFNIEDKKTSLAECIVPKRYKTTFNLGSKALSEIDINDINTPIIRNYDIRKDSDLRIYSNKNTFSVYLNSNLEEDEKNRVFEEDLLHENNNIYIADRNKKLFKVPKWIADSGNFRVYKNKNSYVIHIDSEIIDENSMFELINNFKDIKAVTLKDKDSYDVYNYNVLSKLVPAFNGIDAIKKYYDDGNTDDINIKDILKDYNNRSSKLGFNLSNKIIAARIPGTGMQSEMSMDNVGYIEDDVNDVYVTHFQPWLQGSDFDIDKVYMLMANLGNTGEFESHSPFIDYGTEETFTESYKIGVPSKRYYTKDSNNTDETLISLCKLYEDSSLKFRSDGDKLDKIKDFNKLIDYVQKLDRPDLELGEYNFDNIIADINVHENYDYSENASKNVSYYNILETNKNLTNIIPSYNPVDVGPTKKVINKAVPDNIIYDLGDGNVSVSETQENAGIGKKDVGIFANGNKVFLNLSTYFNNYLNAEEKRTDLISGFPKLILFNDDPDKEKAYYFGMFPDLNASAEQYEEFYDRVKNFKARVKDEDIHKANINQDLVFSELINLATDNAKELQLNKINARLEVAKIHVLLGMLGCTREELVAYTTSGIFTKYVKYLATSPKPSFSEFSEENPEYKPKQVKSLQEAFRLAGGLSNFASILGINQGMSSELSKVLKIKNKFEQIFNDIKIGKPKAATTDSEVDIFADEESAVEPTLGSLAEHYMLQTSGIPQNILDLRGLDFFKFFNDEKYKNLVIDVYESYLESNPTKNIINYYKVLNELPHFYDMLKAMSIGAETLEKSSAKINYAFNDAKDIYFKNYGQIKKAYNEGAIKIATSLYSEQMILDFLQNRKYNGKEYETFDNKNMVDHLLNINMDAGIKDVDLINWSRIKLNSFFTKMIRTYAIDNNFFTSNLELSKLKSVNDAENNKLTIYQLRNNILSNDDPNYQIKMINEFNKIANDTINGQKIGDVLFLYNLIINKNKVQQKAFSRLFENYAKQDGSLPNMFLKFEINYTAKEIDKTTLLASFLESVKKKDTGSLFNAGLFKLLTVDEDQLDKLMDDDEKKTASKKAEREETNKFKKSERNLRLFEKEIDDVRNGIESYAEKEIRKEKEKAEKEIKKAEKAASKLEEKEKKAAIRKAKSAANKTMKEAIAKIEKNSKDVLKKVNKDLSGKGKDKLKLDDIDSDNKPAMSIVNIKKNRKILESNIEIAKDNIENFDEYFKNLEVSSKSIVKAAYVKDHLKSLNELAKFNKLYGDVKENVMDFTGTYKLSASDLTIKNELNELFKSNNLPIQIVYADSDSHVTSKDGITYIYVNKNSKNKFAEFIHEFDHIAFNIYKINNTFPFEIYEDFLSNISDIKYKNGKLWGNINNNIINKHYSNLESSGKIEEMLCRLHTDIVRGEVNIADVPNAILKLLGSSIDILNGLINKDSGEYKNVLNKLTLDVFQSNLNSYIDRNKNIDSFLKTDIMKTKYLRMLENVLKNSDEINQTECK